MERHGDKSWVLVASFLPNRTGKQIRERWHNQLDPAIQKGPWTEEEDAAILDAQKIHGNKWAEIAKLVTNIYICIYVYNACVCVCVCVCVSCTKCRLHTLCVHRHTHSVH